MRAALAALFSPPLSPQRPCHGEGQSLGGGWGLGQMSWGLARSKCGEGGGSALLLPTLSPRSRRLVMRERRGGVMGACPAPHGRVWGHVENLGFLST